MTYIPPGITYPEIQKIADERDALRARVDELSRAYAVQGLALEEERTRVAELEAYQRNAGIWMAELIEKIDRYEGALRRVSVPVGESTLDARIAIATNALTASAPSPGPSDPASASTPSI